MFDKLLMFRQKFSKVFSSKSHAIFLETEDEFLSANVAEMYAMYSFCENEDKPCGRCAGCKKVVGKNSLDVLSYGSNSNILVEDIKDVIEKLNVVPLENSFKIFILNNFDRATLQAQNKLLKSLEEPPKFVKFFLTGKSRKNILPTVSSRCEIITPEKFTREEIFSLLDIPNADLKQIVSENSSGDIGTAIKYSANKNFLDVYDFCLNMLTGMTNSAGMIKYSSVMVKNKQEIELYFTIISNLLRDVLCINSGMPELVNNKYCLNKLKAISKEFSNEAIVKIQNKIVISKQKLSANCSVSGVADEFLLYILEVKWQHKK